MFKGNEKQKKDDGYLSDMLIAEYPGTATYPISGLRSKLNRGGFGEVGFTSKQYGEPAAVPTIGIPETASTAAVQVAETKEGGQ